MAESRKVRFAIQNNSKSSSPPPPYTKIATSNAMEMKNKRGTQNPLEDLVQCALCMDKLTDPKMLPCQHTFCFYCLQSQFSTENQELYCPTCKERVLLENGLDTLEQLPGNLYIDSILKLIAGGSSPPRTPTKFGPETQCIKCQTMCQFSEHACQHCKQVFCGVCWSGHVTELKKQLQSLQEQLLESLGRLDHRIDAFNDRCLQLEENVKSATLIKIEELKKKEDECLLEAKKIKEIGKTSSEELRDRIKNMEKNIVEQELDKITDDNQKISHFMFLHRGTASLLDELSRWGDTRTIFDANRFKFDYEMDANPDAEGDDIDGIVSGVQNPIESEDKQIAYYKTKTFVPRLVWNKCLRPAAVAVAPWNNNYIYIAGTDSRQIYGIDRLKGKLRFRISSPLMLCPVGIAFSHRREEIYVSDKWKHCIHIFSKDGTHLKTLGKKGSANGHFKSPEGISISHDDRLFICDTGNDRIQVINVTDTKFLYAFGISKQNSTSPDDIKYTELNCPTGIAVTEDKVIIADSGNRRIKMYTLEGTKVCEFGSLGKNKGQFRAPEVVAVDPMGFILVGDSGNARIQIFKPNGTLVRVFGTKANLAWVSGLYVSPQLDIIVTDYKNHNVNIF